MLVAGYADLASVHSVEEHASIVNICATVANRDGHIGEAQACWIGMTDRPAAGTQAAEGNWRWSDGSAVNFLAWTPGEPNNWRVAGSVSSQYGTGLGENGGAGLGEDVVSISFASSQYPGGWNDEHGEQVRKSTHYVASKLCHCDLSASASSYQSWAKPGSRLRTFPQEPVLGAAIEPMGSTRFASLRSHQRRSPGHSW